MSVPQFTPVKEIIQKNEISVFLRLKPLLMDHEGHEQTVEVDERNVIMKSDEQKKSYTFSEIFLPETSNLGIFERILQPEIDVFLKGKKNVALFTYGITGSGKTYTISGNRNQKGLLHFAVASIFESHRNPSYAIKIKIFEIYNKTVFNLLEEVKYGFRNEILPRKKYGVKYDDLTTRIQDEDKKELEAIPIRNVSECFLLLHKSATNRQSHSTKLNPDSSRSHVIYQFELCALGFRGQVISTLSIVDLAGSERTKKIKASERSTKIETCNINQSLFTLSKCINALRYNSRQLSKKWKPRRNTTSNKGPNLKTIPFRESTLTKIFRQFFNVNSQLAGRNDYVIRMIVNLSPARCFEKENRQVLEFGAIASDIKETVSRVVTWRDSHIVPPPPRVDMSKYIHETELDSLWEIARTEGAIRAQEDAREQAKIMEKLQENRRNKLELFYGEMHNKVVDSARKEEKKRKFAERKNVKLEEEKTTLSRKFQNLKVSYNEISSQNEQLSSKLMEEQICIKKEQEEEEVKKQEEKSISKILEELESSKQGFFNLNNSFEQYKLEKINEFQDLEGEYKKKIERIENDNFELIQERENQMEEDLERIEKEKLELVHQRESEMEEEKKMEIKRIEKEKKMEIKRIEKEKLEQESQMEKKYEKKIELIEQEILELVQERENKKMMEKELERIKKENMELKKKNEEDIRKRREEREYKERLKKATLSQQGLVNNPIPTKHRYMLRSRRNKKQILSPPIVPPPSISTSAKATPHKTFNNLDVMLTPQTDNMPTPPVTSFITKTKKKIIRRRVRPKGKVKKSYNEKDNKVVIISAKRRTGRKRKRKEDIDEEFVLEDEEEDEDSDEFDEEDDGKKKKRKKYNLRRRRKKRKVELINVD